MSINCYAREMTASERESMERATAEIDAEADALLRQLRESNSRASAAAEKRGYSLHPKIAAKADAVDRAGPMTDEQIAAKRAYIREYRRKRRAAGLETMGNGSRDDRAAGARMVLTPWTVEPNGVMSRELRGV